MTINGKRPMSGTATRWKAAGLSRPARSEATQAAPEARRGSRPACGGRVAAARGRSASSRSSLRALIPLPPARGTLFRGRRIQRRSSSSGDPVARSSPSRISSSWSQRPASSITCVETSRVSLRPPAVEHLPGSRRNRGRGRPSARRARAARAAPSQATARDIRDRSPPERSRTSDQLRSPRPTVHDDRGVRSRPPTRLRSTAGSRGRSGPRTRTAPGSCSDTRRSCARAGGQAEHVTLPLCHLLHADDRAHQRRLAATAWAEEARDDARRLPRPTSPEYRARDLVRRTDRCTTTAGAEALIGVMLTGRAGDGKRRPPTWLAQP